jgi:signal transduction histidine kinase
MHLRTENNLRAAVVILSLAALLSLCSGADLWAREKAPAPKRVLALFLFQHGRMPWTYRLEESLRLALAENSSSPVELDIEHAAHSSFSEKRFCSSLVKQLRKKYAERKVDLVLALGDVSTELVLENGAMIFGDIPMVLVTSDRKKLLDNRLRPNMAAFKWGVDFKKTGSLILDLLPQTQNLFVVSGTSQFDQKIKEMAAADLGQLHDRLTIHYLDDFSIEELLLKVARLPENSAILYLTMYHDSEDREFVPREIGANISKKANAPTFGMADTGLGYGIVGGNLFDTVKQGKRCAEISIKILAGEPLTNLEFMEKGNQLMFDARQLKRWSIDEAKLPAGSVVLYREPSLWGDHKREIVGTFLIIVIQALVLIGLLIQHGRRSRAEEESQRLRDELAHVSRVQAMGEIAASLAHEINQPLSAVRNYAQAGQRFLNNNPAEPGEVVKALAGVVVANRRAEEVVKRIRMALKKESFKQSRLKIEVVMQDVLMFVRSKAEERNILLKFEIAGGLPPLFGDRVQLQQVIINLIINAIEAIEDVGDSSGEVIVQARRENSEAVTISVRDSGIGIDEEQMDILFDAFYTTKPEGMGMGLSISRTIIEEHCGRLWAARNSGKGSTFSFTVPIYEEG